MRGMGGAEETGHLHLHVLQGSPPLSPTGRGKLLMRLGGAGGGAIAHTRESCVPGVHNHVAPHHYVPSPWEMRSGPEEFAVVRLAHAQRTPESSGNHTHSAPKLQSLSCPPTIQGDVPGPIPVFDLPHSRGGGRGGGRRWSDSDRGPPAIAGNSGCHATSPSEQLPCTPEPLAVVDELLRASDQFVFSLTYAAKWSTAFPFFNRPDKG